MDTRAELLLDELSTHPQGKPIEFTYWRDRFQTLFKENMDEVSRVTLLGSYAALLNLMERGLTSQGADPTAFQDARRAEWNFLCIQEAMHRNGTESYHPSDLDEIVCREVAAGRMSDSDFTQLAAAGAQVFRSHDKAEIPKQGFLRRFFGR